MIEKISLVVGFVLGLIVLWMGRITRLDYFIVWFALMMSLLVRVIDD